LFEIKLLSNGPNKINYSTRNNASLLEYYGI
jgi:hypothetical protein